MIFLFVKLCFVTLLTGSPGADQPRFRRSGVEFCPCADIRADECRPEYVVPTCMSQLMWHPTIEFVLSLCAAQLIDMALMSNSLLALEWLHTDLLQVLTGVPH